MSEKWVLSGVAAIEAGAMGKLIGVWRAPEGHFMLGGNGYVSHCTLVRFDATGAVDRTFGMAGLQRIASDSAADSVVTCLDLSAIGLDGGCLVACGVRIRKS